MIRTAATDSVKRAARRDTLHAMSEGPSVEQRVIGAIGLWDPPRTDSAEAAERLHALGVGVSLCTGDHAEAARWWQRNVERIPLTRAPFLAGPETSWWRPTSI